MTAIISMAGCDSRHFDLENKSAYQRWRAIKLANYPERLDSLIVDIADPCALSSAERHAILRACKNTNMALFRVSRQYRVDKASALSFGAQLGLRRLAHNLLSDDDGMTTLRVTPEKSGRGYIPYSNKRLLWHTDGYYNTREETIGAFLLFCVSPAFEGGINALLDPEMVYLQLRDANPDWVRALMAPDVMMIPANTEPGQGVRPARTGPVFSIDPTTGGLQMRYTARTQSIIWKTDGATQAALTALKTLVSNDAPYVFTHCLEAGDGIVCNNVLHSRTAFTDTAGNGRIMLRARYYDRITNVGSRENANLRMTLL